MNTLPGVIRQNGKVTGIKVGGLYRVLKLKVDREVARKQQEVETNNKPKTQNGPEGTDVLTVQ